MPSATLFSDYATLSGTYDELFLASGQPRPTFAGALPALDSRSPEEFARLQALSELALLNQGVTFSVYADDRGTEKIFPFCLMPRLISAVDWAQLERGLTQRLQALEAFLDDVYGPQRILAEKVVPAELVLGAKGYDPRLRGVRPPGGVRIHVSGIDLIRDPAGTFRVLEDNLRCPSGVSYVLENRLLSKRVLPDALERVAVHRVDQYPARLATALRSVSPEAPERSTVVVLTPGPFNSAYFEHSFLARTMGMELVQAPDLFVDGDEVFMHTTRGPRRVHVIYRRTDDAFLDPRFFRSDSMLGVPGLVRAWAAGKVTLANAPGNGVADDKAIYALVPEMIRFYLSEEPLLAQVDTFVCARPGDQAYVLDRIEELVVKAVDEAGGYGMLMGPQASAAERETFRERVRAEPRKYIAQHRVELSACPTWDGAAGRMVPRRVDLRPYIVNGREGPWVLPGGLTRVALRAGSYVVNSSQGGGSKDTWVLKGGRGVISRVADNLFWLGRYLERAESTARVLSVTRNLSLDGELRPRQAWLPAVIVFGEEGPFRARRGETALDDGEVVQAYLTWEDEAASITQAVRAARENARWVREVVSLEAWESINALHLWLSGAGQEAFDQDRHGFYRSVRDAVQRTLGMVYGTMPHDDAFDFMLLGLSLERAGQTARTLDVHHHALAGAHRVVETALWLALLRACSGFEPYMKRFQGQASASSVARFLVLDVRFPRSVAHCLHDAVERLARIRTQAADARGRSLPRLRALEAWVLDEAEPAVDGGALHDLLTQVVDESHEICDEIGRELLGAPTPAALAGASPTPQ